MCNYFTCLNFSHLWSTPHVMQYTYWDIFSTAQNSFWTHPVWCLLMLLPFFISLLSHRQNVSFENFFHPRKSKKCLGIRLGEYGGRDMESFSFWSKTAEQSAQCEQIALISHPSRNGQMCWQSSKKNSLKPNAASQTTLAGRYTDTGGFLEHSPSREVCTTRGPPSRR